LRLQCSLLIIKNFFFKKEDNGYEYDKETFAVEAKEIAELTELLKPRNAHHKKSNISKNKCGRVNKGYFVT